MPEMVAKSSPFSNRFWSHKITGTSHDEAHVSWFTTSENVARLLPGRRCEDVTYLRLVSAVAPGMDKKSMAISVIMLKNN
ncbi:Uncharacterised protein [Salmonella enterica subsp. enterica]|uniref:Uncharacterized protein n=1 Tax=Salmonella enterica I TaxID=59201 RepID=A0A447U0Z1_SALET|nr:Uncharacterised protein [Salmonella enterica subsp. enterica]